MSDTREALLEGIRAHRDQFEAAGDRAEELRTLPPDAVATLRALGLFGLKTPAELGGTPLSPLEFSDVIEELAYIDTSTAWAAMIGAGCAGLAGGWLPEAGARRIFSAAGAGRLPVVAGQLAPRGTGTAVAGGYLVSGRWGFSSGIVHADWLIGAFKTDSAPDDGDRAGTGFGRMVVFLVPKAEAEVIDNWHVAGLQGTGSLDFSLDGVFVPAEQTYDLGTPAVRGGDLFRLGMPAFVVQRGAAAGRRPGPPGHGRHDRAGHPHRPVPGWPHGQRAGRLPPGARPRRYPGEGGPGGTPGSDGGGMGKRRGRRCAVGRGAAQRHHRLGLRRSRPARTW